MKAKKVNNEIRTLKKQVKKLRLYCECLEEENTELKRKLNKNLGLIKMERSANKLFKRNGLADDYHVSDILFEKF